MTNNYTFPLYNITTKQWSEYSFNSKKEYRDYIDSYFKYPGEYNLKYTNGYWNEQAEFFEKHKSYPKFVPKSKDFKKHWDFEKLKCSFEGIIIYRYEENGKTYDTPVPSLYYWYLNYILIYDKVKAKNTFAEVWDGDYHYFLYILRCILHGKYAAILKKRQSGYTLKNMAIMLNATWFGQSWINKIFSHDESHVKDSWSFLTVYRDHLNNHCGWKRGFQPDVVLNWQVKRKRNDGSLVGNLSVLQGFSTKMDPSKGVGGSIKVLFGEEAGKNPTLDKTHEYVTSNVSLGGISTGLIVYSGAVGELDKCEPLKKFILKPKKYNFLETENKCKGDEELGQWVGFFAPEWWNYKYEDEETAEIVNCYDKWGNSNQEQALIRIRIERKKNEEKDPEDYRYYCSQRPLSITEALSYRKDPIFPQALIERQLYRIEQNSYPYTVCDIDRDNNGVPVYKKALYSPIEEFPYKPNKKVIPFGAIKVWEDVTSKPEWGTFYAAVDPIYVDHTTTSESLFSVIIYKNLIEKRVYDEETQTIKTILEGDRIVASYIGRKEDIKKTNEVAELLIEKYNAFTICENNVDNFIKHMISKNKQKHLATKSDLPFLRELNTNKTSYQEYGVRTNTTMWTHYINKILEYIKEEIGVEHKNNGEVLRIVYGIEKIPDKRLLKELLNFEDQNGNYDQIITLGLVLSLAKALQANGLIKKQDVTGEKTKKQGYIQTVRSPFRKNSYMGNKLKSPFRSLKR